MAGLLMSITVLVWALLLGLDLKCWYTLVSPSFHTYSLSDLTGFWRQPLTIGCWTSDMCLTLFLTPDSSNGYWAFPPSVSHFNSVYIKPVISPSSQILLSSPLYLSLQGVIIYHRLIADSQAVSYQVISFLPPMYFFSPEKLSNL